MAEKYFTLDNSKYACYPGLVPLLNKLLFLDKCNQLYETIPVTTDLATILESILTSLEIKIIYNESLLFAIPAEGPVVIVSNHPFGGLDGIILASILLKRRPDLKVLANYLLTFISPLAPLFISLDPINKLTSRSKNFNGLKEAYSWLSLGKSLLIFPSGTVSHLHILRGKVEDPVWNNIAIRLSTLNNATIVPIYVHGRNSWYFQLAGMIHPFLRTILLPQQFYAKKQSTINVAIGNPILQAELPEITVDSRTQFLREKTYQLS